ncbi:MAG: response regulator [Planctomycetota bacterium]|jgi:DNA-binding NarL/FixJ family response regulator
MNLRAGRTRIAVVDNHPVVLEGLTQLINREDDLVVCATAGNTKQALETLEGKQIDLAIVDVLLQRTTGIQVTRKLRSRYPGLHILILSMSDDPDHVKRAFQAGARGYITKDEVSEKIIAGIRRVCKGEIYVTKRLSRRFSKQTIAGWILEADGENTPDEP